MLVNFAFRAIVPALGAVALGLWILRTFNIPGPLWPAWCRLQRKLKHENRYQLPEAEA